MKLYLVYDTTEDNNSWRDVINQVEIYTESQFRKTCEDYIKCDAITIECACDVLGLEEEDMNIDDFDSSICSIDQIIEMFTYEGFDVEIITIPDIEVGLVNGKYCVKETIQKEICDESGKPYRFDTKKEAENYVDNFKGLINQED